MEDDPEEARWLREILEEPGSHTDITQVERMADAERHLAAHQVDIILLDPGLPDSEGIESVRRARVAAPSVPLVVLTGRDDEALALEALREGAQDYLIKGRGMPKVPRALRYAIERKALEEVLFAEKERAEVTLRSIGDAVISTDASGIITFLNQGAETLTGWTSAEATGRPMAEVFRIMDGETRETIPSPMDEAIGQDRTVHLPTNCLLTGRDGVEIPIEDGAWPMHDRQGDATGAVIVFRDVSAAQLAEREQRTLTEELARSNRELQDFATIASHDLQEPLRKIQMFGDRLSERAAGALDEEGDDYLRRMKNAAGRMQNLINNLVEYSQVAVSPEPLQAVDLGQVVADVLSDLDARIRASDGRVVVGPLPTIIANPFQMGQLFQNLIANSLKFHPPGVAPEVHVEAAVGGSDYGPAGRRDRQPVWEIRVRDNGIGFEDKHVEKIFAPFQRLNGPSEYEGTGMGLAICRRIVLLAGGTISARSQPGEGATFLLTLPRTAPASGGVAPAA